MVSWNQTSFVFAQYQNGKDATMSALEQFLCTMDDFVAERDGGTKQISDSHWRLGGDRLRVLPSHTESSCLPAE